MITKPQSSLIWNWNDMYWAFNINHGQVLGAVKSPNQVVTWNLSTIENQIIVNVPLG